MLGGAGLGCVAYFCSILVCQLERQGVVRCRRRSILCAENLCLRFAEMCVFAVRAALHCFLMLVALAESCLHCLGGCVALHTLRFGLRVGVVGG